MCANTINKSGLSASVAESHDFPVTSDALSALFGGAPSSVDAARGRARHPQKWVPTDLCLMSSRKWWSSRRCTSDEEEEVDEVVTATPKRQMKVHVAARNNGSRTG